MTATGAIATQCAGTTVLLLPQRALYWPDERTLFVADAHFGKSASFRARGVFVPRGTTSETLDRLDRAIAHTLPRRLLFLGDFFHSRASQAAATLDALGLWRNRHQAITMHLVGGNHDRHAGAPPSRLAIEPLAVNTPLGPFVLAHEPAVSDGGYVLAGHLHPAYRLTGRAGDSLRLPCFWLRSRCLVVPALGSFTGGALIQPMRADKVFLVTDERVFAVPISRERSTS